MIKVLIVDDSKVIQEFLNHLLISDPNIEVVGIASSGFEAIELVRILKPDVITMDIQMPWMDGYEATRTIMETYPTPTIIVSGNEIEIDSTKRYMEAGALAIIIRPNPFDLPKYTDFLKEFTQCVKLMSEVKVVKLIPRSKKNSCYCNRCIYGWPYCLTDNSFKITEEFPNSSAHCAAHSCWFCKSVSKNVVVNIGHHPENC
jgi:chemotaxis response regulator CheB